MATVNKDFKIKSGLVVEGLNGTINGYNILTESQDSQDFILDLIGGETLVKSVSSEFDVSVAGELSLDRTVVDAYYDAAGDAADALADANSYTDGRETAITSAYQSYADTAAGNAEDAANTYTDGRETAITTAYQNYADQAETDAKAYTDARETAITSAYQSYADTAEQDAKNYADDLINDASNLSTEVWSAYKTSTEIGLAQAAAEQHADEAVAALVDSAPALLDTLNELAAAINDDANFASTIGTSIGEKVAKAGDTMTGALTLSGAPTSNLHAATKAYVDSAESNAISTAESYTDGEITTALSTAQGYADTAESDAIAAAGSYTDGEITTALSTAQGYANTAEQNAIAHADALTTDDVAEGTTQYFTDARAKTSAADLLTGATLSNITITGNGSGLTITAENGVADSDTDDLDEGTSNLYFTDQRAIDALDGTTPTFAAVDINSIAKQVAGTTVVPVAGIATAYSWAKADYRSAEFLVKIAQGDHTEVSKVLLTLQTNDNISITEYGIVGTNGDLGSVSATISGNDVQLQVTTANNTSTVTVVGTLLV
jgi:hypothetical protein